MNAYRSAPLLPTPTFAIRCVACGTPATATPNKPEVRCSGCHLEQPVLREELEWPIASKVAKTFVPGKYHELALFARAVGVDEQCALISLACDGIVCEVALDIVSGSVRGIEVSATTSGFPEVSFRREEPGDTRAKQSGVTVEVQTGDAAFDAAVFIVTDAAPDDVRTVVASPAVRSAIRALLRDFAAVVLTPEYAKATGRQAAAYTPVEAERHSRRSGSLRARRDRSGSRLRARLCPRGSGLRAPSRCRSAGPRSSSGLSGFPRSRRRSPCSARRSASWSGSRSFLS